MDHQSKRKGEAHQIQKPINGHVNRSPPPLLFFCLNLAQIRDHLGRLLLLLLHPGPPRAPTRGPLLPYPGPTPQPNFLQLLSHVRAARAPFVVEGNSGRVPTWII